ncbi:cytochrome b/b6 domain-containing protein [Arthrobacter sp. D1-29]
MAGYTPLAPERTGAEPVPAERVQTHLQQQQQGDPPVAKKAITTPATIDDVTAMIDKTQLQGMDLPAAREREQPKSAAEHAPARKRRMGAAAQAAEQQEVERPSTNSAVEGGSGAAQTGLVTPTAKATSSTRLLGAKGAAGGGPVSKSHTAGPAWRKPAVVIAVFLVLGLLVVFGARWLRTLEGVQQFVMSYSGHAWQPEGAPVGIPAWLGWQHFFNMFFIVLIVRTGLQVRTERKPPGYWTAKKDSFFSPKGNSPKKVSLSLWLHQSLDVLWAANGMIFVALLLVSGHWTRIVPTSWDIFPNMLSAAVQYASLDWPAENGWVHYNALQVMAYFLTVFIAAPLAVLTGVRMSTWWPERARRLTKIYPVEWARALHFPVMLYFVAFTVVHVFLVFFTGALQNLNHMYGSRNVVDWWGLVIFLISLLVIAAAWFLIKPLFTTPIASRMGKVTK